ncbi:MAG: PH domain-containing protein [Dermatophilaceae bacterium]
MGYESYLLDGERRVLGIHRHWARLVAPVAAVVGGLVAALLVDAAVAPGARLLANLVWLGWLYLAARLAWIVVDWRTEWFIATDKRLLLIHGVIARNTGMMPLTKVTDMTFVRTLPGLLLGYGTFVLESAGQDQALHEIRWIPHPERIYRAIVAEIFGVHDRYRLPPDAEGPTDPGQPPGGGGGPGGDPGSGGPRESWPRPTNRARRWTRRPDPGRRPQPPRPQPPTEHSRAIPVHRPAPPETLYRSSDHIARDRAADTGPIPWYEQP